MSWKTNLVSAGCVLSLAVAVPVLAAAERTGDAEQATSWRVAGVVPQPAAQDSAGKAIFASKGLCYACHGPDAKGTPLAPNLTDTEWLNIDGELENIVGLIKKGVPQPKKAPAPMPPMGGAQLSDAEVQAVAQYVYSLSHPAK